MPPSFYKGELQGQVLVDGKPTVDYGPGELSLKIGYVFQNPFNQISGVKDTLFEEVAFGLENFGVPPEEIEERVVEVMKMTNILQLAEKNPFELSGGQMQRVALASVIVLKPDILVIDEPTAGQDLEGNIRLGRILKELHEQGKTVITISHDMEFVVANFERVIVMANKKVVTSGTPREVFWNFPALEQAMLKQPYVSRVCHTLGVGEDVITLEEAVAAIRARCV